MATADDVHRARRQGEKDGYAAAVEQLRAFTGVEGIEPDLESPEHAAYPTYLQDLSEERDQIEAALENDEASIADLTDRSAKAAEDHSHALQDRREARADRNVLVRFLGLMGDHRLPSAHRVRLLEGELMAQHTLLARHQQVLRVLDGEIEQVTAWIADMLAAADTIKVDQQEAEFRREQERVQAERDVSPRWCIVYDTLDDFIAEDPRRQARAWNPPVVAGADFGYDWHRDLDDGPDAPGQWSLHYIQENHETILEYRPLYGPVRIWLLGTAIEDLEDAMKVFGPIDTRERRLERNSVAIVLDTYAAYASAQGGTALTQVLRSQGTAEGSVDS